MLILDVVADAFSLLAHQGLMGLQVHPVMMVSQGCLVRKGNQALMDWMYSWSLKRDSHASFVRQVPLEQLALKGNAVEPDKKEMQDIQVFPEGLVKMEQLDRLEFRVTTALRAILDIKVTWVTTRSVERALKDLKDHLALKGRKVLLVRQENQAMNPENQEKLETRDRMGPVENEASVDHQDHGALPASLESHRLIVRRIAEFKRSLASHQGLTISMPLLRMGPRPFLTHLQLFLMLLQQLAVATRRKQSPKLLNNFDHNLRFIQIFIFLFFVEMKKNCLPVTVDV